MKLNELIICHFTGSYICEICLAAETAAERNPWYETDTIYTNPHCVALLRNRKSRKNKKINPKQTVF